MEKTLFFRRLIPFGAGLGFKRIVQISAFKITDKRIKGTMCCMTIFEELLSEISSVKVIPCFVGAQVEIKPKTHNRREYYFMLPELRDLVNVLKKLKINVECDEAVLDREIRRNIFNNNPIVKIITVMLALSFLVFIVYHIFLLSGNNRG
jgi:hypothetical protein